MTDLEQAVGDAVPVLQHLVVRRDAEVEHGQGYGRRRQFRAAFGQHRQIRQDVFQVDQGVAEGVQLGLDLVVGLVAALTAAGTVLGFGPKKLVRQDVHLRCLDDGLHRVLPEQVVAPFGQVVDVFHQQRLLVGDRPEPRDHVGLEGLGPPFGDRELQFLPFRRIGIGDLVQQCVDALIDVVADVRQKKRLCHPVLFRRVARQGAGGIEHVVEPG